MALGLGWAEMTANYVNGSQTRRYFVHLVALYGRKMSGSRKFHCRNEIVIIVLYPAASACDVFVTVTVV